MNLRGQNTLREAEMNTSSHLTVMMVFYEINTQKSSDFLGI